MSTLDLGRWQFGITTVYHFFMVPLTIGLSMIVAWFHTRWYRSGDESDLRLTKFFGKLFLVNFAMGVVTGIVQEFQFGMNWSNYSRFVGDVFGAPLAMEALVAFFLESTFIGLWIFGWDRLPRKAHLATIWLTAIGTWLSAYFIIAANSWMQHPVGVELDPDTGRPVMVSIWAVLTNPTTLAAYPHVVISALMTAAAFVGGISAWMLMRRRSVLTDADAVAWRRVVRGMSVLTLVAFAGIAITGDFQARLMFEQQPMKMASAEALCDTTKGAPLSVFSIPGGENNGVPCSTHELSIPDALSWLATHDTQATVQGVNDLNASYQAKFGPGDYVPNMLVTYWGFRVMILFGSLAAFGAVVALWVTRRGRDVPTWRWLPPATLAMMITPFLGNVAGWVFTEMGRQPWVVAPNPTGIPEIRLLTADAVSAISPWSVGVTLVGFTLLYGALAIVELKLLAKYVKAGPSSTATPEPQADADGHRPMAFAY